MKSQDSIVGVVARLCIWCWV